VLASVSQSSFGSAQEREMLASKRLRNSSAISAMPLDRAAIIAVGPPAEADPEAQKRL